MILCVDKHRLCVRDLQFIPAIVVEALDAHPLVMGMASVGAMIVVFPLVKQGRSLLSQAMLPCALMGFVSGYAYHSFYNEPV